MKTFSTFFVLCCIIFCVSFRSDVDDNSDLVLEIDSTVFPPFRPLEIKESCGIVYHACEWDRNYLDKKHTEDLSDFLTEHEQDIEFVFMENL